MSTFHKPRVFRSSEGCCICKAKSSTSKFTDSKKYESDFTMCFQLSSPRQGEICNACVLLVKRFKRLPAGSSRHWGHVVDARVGPGIKCMYKVKMRCEESLKKSRIGDCEGGLSGEEKLWGYDEPANDEDIVLCSKRKIHNPRKNNYKPVHNTHFLNKKIWKKVTICCADVWKNSYGQSALELTSLRSCPLRNITVQEIHHTNIRAREGRTLIPKRVINDNSSDSGYDESSCKMSSNRDSDDIVKESKNAVEKIFRDIGKSSNTKQLVVGTVSGWVTGYIGMKLGKVAAVGLGSGVILLHLANQNGYININWDKIHKNADDISNKITNETSKSSPWLDKLINFMRHNTYYSAGFTGGVLFGIASS